MTTTTEGDGMSPVHRNYDDEEEEDYAEDDELSEDDSGPWSANYADDGDNLDVRSD